MKRILCTVLVGLVFVLAVLVGTVISAMFMNKAGEKWRNRRALKRAGQRISASVRYGGEAVMVPENQAVACRPVQLFPSA